MAELSIIVPLYNSEKYIEKCIESIILEMSSYDELIIVDDGSTDASLDICNRFTSDNIKVFHNDNHGVSFSRNFGVKHSNGKYITFIDSDDSFSPGWRETLDAGIRTNSDVVYYSYLSENKLTNTDIVYSIICQNTRINTSSCWGKLYKKSFIENYGIEFQIGLTLGEDACFNLDIISHKPDYSIIGCKKFYNYYLHSDSTTRAANSQIVENMENYIQEVEKRLKNIQFLTNKNRNEIMLTSVINSSFAASYNYSFSHDFGFAKQGYIYTKKLFKYIPHSDSKLDLYCNFEKKTIFLFLNKDKYLIMFLWFSIRSIAKKILRR